MHMYQVKETIHGYGSYIQTLFAKMLNCEVECDGSNVVRQLQEKSQLVLNEHTNSPEKIPPRPVSKIYWQGGYYCL